MTGKRYLSRFLCGTALLVTWFSCSHNALAGYGLRISGGGGTTSPTGEWHGTYQTGWRGHIGIMCTSPTLPLALRVTGSHAHYNLPRVAFGQPVRTSTFTSTGGRADIVWSLPLGTPLRPYIFAGYGVYRFHFSYNGDYYPDAVKLDFTDDAIESGGGISIPWGSVAMDVEASYQHMVASHGFQAYQITAALSYNLIP